MTFVRASLIAFLTSLVALAGSLGWAFTSKVDSMDHERYTLALRTATALTAALDREIAECRLDLVTHYDGLVRVSDATSQTLASLKHFPRHVPLQYKVFLEQAVKRYQGVAQEQEVLVQRFKTDHAVLRNSLRALPEIAERLIPKLRQERQLELLSALQSLLQDVLLLSVDPSAARVNQARCALNAFPGRPTGAVENCAVAKLAITDLPAEDALVLDGFVLHARSAIARHGAVSQLVSELMHLPVAKRAEEAAATYANIYSDTLREASQRWQIVSLLLIMAIVSGAAYIILRLQSSATLLRDATAQLKIALAKLTHERDQEAELANLRSRFVSMTSHEFRTPLSVILSSAELLENYADRWSSEKRNLHLTRIQQASRSISRMLDSVLLIGRAEAGMLDLTLTPLDLSAFTSSIIEEVSAGPGAGRSLDYSEENPDGCDVWLDEKLVRHILTNLLSNAFKYSPENSPVELRVRVNDEHVSFVVQDSGIGIPEHEQSEVFEAFKRCSNVGSIPGTGLGLAIVKRCVEVHQGTLTVDSEPGRGTSFSVQLPLKEEGAA